MIGSIQTAQNNPLIDRFAIDHRAKSRNTGDAWPIKNELGTRLIASYIFSERILRSVRTGKYLGNKVSAVGSYLRLELPSPSLEDDGTREPTELLQSGYRYALALTHHSHDAEDLVQEAWLKLSLKYGEGPSRRLFFTTVRNLFIDHCRRTKRVGFESLTDDRPDDTDREPLGGSSGDLEHFLQLLRPVERETIYLHYIEGHTAEEISSITQRPRNTVLSLLHRALKKLQKANDRV